MKINEILFNITEYIARKTLSKFKTRSYVKIIGDNDEKEKSKKIITQSDVNSEVEEINAYDRIKCIHEFPHHDDDSTIDREIKCIDGNRGDQHAIGKVIKC